MKKVLLLNPPGEDLYLRDYYCSKIAKANYIYHPVDLLILSGILYGKYELKVIDAMVFRLGFEECLKQILNTNADVVIFLSGVVSWKKDFEFVSKIKEHKPDCVIMTSADLVMEKGEDILRDYPFLDAAILDFTNNDAIHYLEGDYGRIQNMVFRDSRGQIVKHERRDKNMEFEIPLPRHELFPNKYYTYPFVKRLPFATVLTNYGCPFGCSFCIMSTLGFKSRTIDNVLAELDYVVSLGIKEVYFSDQTFGGNRDGTARLCRGMINKKFSFGWACFSRVDIVDDELIQLMKRSGCHTIMFGAESANDKILRSYNKGFDKEKIRYGFNLCRRHKIRTVATFIIGLPGETKEDCLNTIKFAKELNPDYVSFNVPVPRMRTKFRREAIQHGWTPDKIMVMGQAYSPPVIGTPECTRDDIWQLCNKAIRDFYFRPSYILKRLFSIRTAYELRTNIETGLMLFKRSSFR